MSFVSSISINHVQQDDNGDVWAIARISAGSRTGTASPIATEQFRTATGVVASITSTIKAKR